MLKDKENLKKTALFLVLTVLFSALVFLPQETFATTIFSDEFESGDFSEWSTTSGSPTVQSSIKYNGTYAMLTNATSATSYALKDIGTMSDAFLYMEIRFPVLPSTGEVLWVASLIDDSSASNVMLGLYNNSGNLEWAFLGAEQVSAEVIVDTWYSIEIERKVGDGVGFRKLWVNGVNLVNTENATISNGAHLAYVGKVSASELIQHYVDCVVVADTYIVPLSSDSTAPIYASLTTSTTASGASCDFGITVTDETDLSFYIFSTNNTGSWSNNTAVAFSTNPQTVSVSKTLNSTIGTIVGYQWFFNDTTNNWNSTSIQSLTTTDSTIPSFSTITGNTTYANTAVSYNCTISDNIAVSGFIASWNNTGSWVNGTWTSGGSGVLTGTHNSTSGSIVSVRFYANDTTNNWAASSIANFTLTDGTTPTSSAISSSSTTAGSTCTFTVTVTDETNLSHWIFGTNNTGSWINATATAFSTNPETVTINQVLSGVIGRIVGYQWFYNDSSNNWGSSSVYTLAVTEVSIGGGGVTDGTTPTAVPYQTPSVLGAVDFQVDNINLGTVNPNSTVTGQLHFRFSGSSYKLQSIIFQEPFNFMYVHDATFTQATYIITSNSQGEDTVNLTFNIPSNIPVQRFTSGFQVIAIDAAGGEHKSNGEITFIVAGATEDFGYFLRKNPIYILFIAIAILLALVLIVVFSRKR
jgi:hypothetical protein